MPLVLGVEAAPVLPLERELAAGRGRPGDLVLCTRNGQPHSQRNLAQRGVGKAAEQAGLRHVTPQDLRRSFCSLSGRRGVDPVEAPQMTGHSPEVWARLYARSFGKAQRDEARQKMLAHGFGEPPPPASPTSRTGPVVTAMPFRPLPPPASPGGSRKPLQITGGACRDRTGDLRLAKP